MAQVQQPQKVQNKGERYDKSQKQQDVRSMNIVAAKALADVLRTSLGPRGMDKMIQDSKGQVLITNDGATILKQMEVVHPTAKMLVEISKAQDVEVGDGTTSVVVIAGALLEVCQGLLERGIHPTQISDAFQHALDKSLEFLKEISMNVDLNDKDKLTNCVTTSLASKVVSSNLTLAPLAVEAILKIINPKTATNVDLNDIKIVKKLGGTIDDTELIKGLVFPNNRPSHAAGGPSEIKNPKIALIQFCLSPPKTDIDNQVVVKDYAAMDRILREERKYTASLVSKIVKSGANVLLIQKSILRDATSELSLHFLAKKGIMVVKDIERDQVEFICKTIGCTPISHIDYLTEDKLGKAELIKEETLSNDSKVLKVTGVKEDSKTMTILIRGSSGLVIDEAERSLHDALCVLRSLVKVPSLIPGGGVPEIHLSQSLSKYSQTLSGANNLCVRAFAQALEVIPFTLAENAGLKPINVVTELRKLHQDGIKFAGISLRKNWIVNDVSKEDVLQPLLVTQSALILATECVRMILKIDDLVLTAR